VSDADPLKRYSVALVMIVDPRFRVIASSQQTLVDRPLAQIGAKRRVVLSPLYSPTVAEMTAVAA
jgi:hypothetical protein